MKRVLFVYICTIMACVSVHALDDNALRDSLFRIYHSMPADTTRTLFLHKVFTQNIDKDWSAELLDTALVLAAEVKDVKSESELRYEYFRYYTFRMNGEMMEKTFDLLKDACYRCGEYEVYFQAWHYLLQFKASEGNTEYAIQESQNMRREAVRLEADHGIFLSYVTEGKVNAFARNTEKAIERYKKALQTSPLTIQDELMVRQYLSSSYYLMGKYPEMKEELKTQRNIINRAIKKNHSLRKRYRKVLLEIELLYCKVYLAEESAEELKEHLEEAAKFYSEYLFSSAIINYHFSWAGYYSLKKEWEKCFAEYKLVLAAFKGTQPMYESEMRRLLGDAYMQAGRYQEAAETYKVAALMRDSLNQVALKMNEETVQANYRIQRALFEKEAGVRRFWQVAVGGGSLFLLFLVAGIVQLLHIRRELMKSEKGMREAYAMAQAADKMKDIFLHNITNEIRVPLNLVVSLSDRLCSETGLTEVQRQDFSEAIKRNAEKLTNLIFNILDLARLESGMMKFNVQVYDLVQLCKDVKLMVEMESNHTVEVVFHKETNTLPVSMDVSRFTQLLSSVLMPPKENKAYQVVSYTLRRETDDALKLIVVNSPLLWESEDRQEAGIRHAINRLYLKAFGGSYQLCGGDEERLIIITYPIK